MALTLPKEIVESCVWGCEMISNRKNRPGTVCDVESDSRQCECLSIFYLLYSYKYLIFKYWKFEYWKFEYWILKFWILNIKILNIEYLNIEYLDIKYFILNIWVSESTFVFSDLNVQYYKT